MWQCQICDKTIKGRSGEVKKHYLKLHQSQPIFPCHVCDYTSRTEKMYQAHRMSHLVEYPCQHCGKVKISENVQCSLLLQANFFRCLHNTRDLFII